MEDLKNPIMQGYHDLINYLLGPDYWNEGSDVATCVKFTQQDIERLYSPWNRATRDKYEYRRKHPKCKFCAYSWVENGQYYCPIKDKKIYYPGAPRPFCSYYRIENT